MCLRRWLGLRDLAAFGILGHRQPLPWRIDGEAFHVGPDPQGVALKRVGALEQRVVFEVPRAALGPRRPCLPRREVPGRQVRDGVVQPLEIAGHDIDPRRLSVDAAAVALEHAEHSHGRKTGASRGRSRLGTMKVTAVRFN